MALKLTKNNYYIKIDLQGNFKIYKTAKDRLAEKKAPLFEEICSKYDFIINRLWRDAERFYYDPTYTELVAAWETEAALYCQSHAQGICQNTSKFPLMAQYIKNVGGSLPEIINTGRIWVKGETLAEVYEYVKQQGYFSGVEDC